MNEWISVNEKLPEKPGIYLICTDDEVFSAEYNPRRIRCAWTDDYEGYCDFSPTHWMPLPEPPKGE